MCSWSFRSVVQWLVQSNKRGGREGRKGGRIKLCKKLNPKRLEQNARASGQYLHLLWNQFGETETIRQGEKGGGSWDIYEYDQREKVCLLALSLSLFSLLFSVNHGQFVQLALATQCLRLWQRHFFLLCFFLAPAV